MTGTVVPVIRRCARLTAALTGVGLATLRVPVTGPRGRRRIAVCTAARVLTALGVRVQVVPPPAGWPRATAGRLVVSDARCWIDDLALLTVVPGGPLLARHEPAAAVVRRLCRLAGADPLARPALFQAAVDAAAPVCPVAIRHRVVAGRQLVVEVHLLTALDPAGCDHRQLAVLADRALAGVTAGRPPVPPALPRPALRPLPPAVPAGLHVEHAPAGELLPLELRTAVAAR